MTFKSLVLYAYMQTFEKLYRVPKILNNVVCMLTRMPFMLNVNMPSITAGANILRDSNGNVKIADFGASKRLQVSLSHDLDWFVIPLHCYTDHTSE